MIYWKATTHNGKEISEKDSNWKDVRYNIQSLSLVVDGVNITLPEKMGKYVQAKTASAEINGSDFQIESRYIGVYIGNNIIKIRVDEKTKDISLEIDPL